MGSIVDGNHGGVRETAFHRNGVKLLRDLVRAAYDGNAMFALHFVGYHRWRNENTNAGLSESLHQRAVVELSHDAWPELVNVEPAHQCGSYGGLLAGNEQRGRIKNMRPWSSELCCKPWLGEECNTAVSKFMAIAFHVGSGRHGAVGKHQIQPLDRQLHQETHELVFAADDAHRLGQCHCRG